MLAALGPTLNPVRRVSIDRDVMFRQYSPGVSAGNTQFSMMKLLSISVITMLFHRLKSDPHKATNRLFSTDAVLGPLMFSSPPFAHYLSCHPSSLTYTWKHHRLWNHSHLSSLALFRHYPTPISLLIKSVHSSSHSI